MAMRIFAERALLPEGMQNDVCVGVGERGVIDIVEANAQPRGAPVRRGTLLPGMPNVHSHAFQRAIAAQTQRSGPGDDSFWSWRTQMYRAASELTPDELERQAEAAFREMIGAGYTSVAEFHYIHAAPDGSPYSNRTELSERLIAAARAAGIAITLLPVLYLHAGFGGAPLEPEQRRFSLGLDGYLDLWNALFAAYRNTPGVRIGFAPHSLRAVTDEELRYALDAVRRQDPSTPVHLHIAEQQAEVDACRAAFGTTPIRYLIDRIGIDERWCLVHATHADEAERRAIAQAGAVVGLCPTTEADLGDGIFAAAEFLAIGGRFAIGSDSNVRIDVAEELRLLEYGQRLRLQRRNVMTIGSEQSVGETLYRRALEGGSAALGLGGGAIAPGARARLVFLPGRSDEPFDDFVFSGRLRLEPVTLA